MGLLADYLPNMLPQDPGQNTAARQGLLQFGAALLGGKGNFGSILGQGIAAGAGGYNSSLQALQQKALLDAQTKHYTLGNDADQAALDQKKLISAGLANFNSQQAPGAASSLVTDQPQAASAGPAPLSSLPQSSPAPDAGLPLSMFPQANAAPAQPVAPVSSLPQVGAAPAAADPLAGYKKAVAQYQYLNTNFPGSEEAKAAQKAVETLAPKVKETKVVTLPGTQKRVLANFFENASIPPQILTDISPDMEKLVFGDDGGNRIGQNPFTGSIVSTVKKVVTPGEQLQHDDQVATRAQAERHWKAEQEDGKSPDVADGEKKLWLHQYIAQNGAVPRSAPAFVRNNIGTWAAEMGITPGDLASGAAKAKFDMAAASTSGHRAGSMASVEATMPALTANAVSLAAKLDQGRFVPLNKLVQMADDKISDPTLAALKVAHMAVVSEYQQVIARGGSNVTALKEAMHVLNSATSLPAYTAALNQVNAEVAMNVAGTKKVRSELGGGHGAEPAAKPSVKDVKDLPKTKPAAGGVKFLGYE